MVVEKPASVPPKPRKQGSVGERPLPKRMPRKAVKKDKPPVVAKKKAAVKKKSEKISEKVAKEKTA